MHISEADNIPRDLHNQASLLKCYLRFRLTFSYICFRVFFVSKVCYVNIDEFRNTFQVMSELMGSYQPCKRIGNQCFL